MGNLQGYEILLLVLVVVLLFGAKKLPEAARGLGRSLRIFKSEVKQPDSAAEVDRDGNVIVAPAVITQAPVQMATPVPPVASTTAYVPVQTAPVAEPIQTPADPTSVQSVNERFYGQEHSDR